MRMRFVPPPVQTLIDGAALVRGDYENNNPDRIRLLDILDISVKLIKKSMKNAYLIKPQDLQNKLLGAYVFCLERIDSSYWLRSSEWWSTLVQAILKYLGVTNNNKLDDQTRFVSISRFLALVKENQAFFQDQGIDSDVLIRETEVLIPVIFKRLQPATDQLMKLIPTEKAMDAKMKIMLTEYQKQATNDNPDRIFLAALVTAAYELNPCTLIESDYDYPLNFTERTKVGSVIFIGQFIWHEYKFPSVRSPKGRSVLYDLACMVLNNDGRYGLYDLDPNFRLLCLSAFDGMVTDKKCAQNLEKKIKALMPNSDINIGVKIINLRDKLKEKIDELKSSLSTCYNPSTITKISTILGGLMGAVPGYAFGISCIKGVSFTNLLVPTKVAMGETAGAVMSVMMGRAGELASYYVADKFVDAALERAIGVACQSLGIVVGAATGGLTSIILFDLSYATFKHLWTCCAKLHEELGMGFAKDVDPEFIECLMTLPNDVFDAEKKKTVKRITMASSQMSLFNFSDSEPDSFDDPSSSVPLMKLGSGSF